MHFQQAQNSFGGFTQAAAVPNIAQLATLVAANGGAGEWLHVFITTAIIFSICVYSIKPTMFGDRRTSI